MITIKSKLAYRSAYIALSAIIIFSLLIFYLPTTAKAVDLSLNGVSARAQMGTIQNWNAQLDFYPGDHPGIQDNGGNYDFLPYWSTSQIVVYDSNGAQVAFAQFNWDGLILDGSPHFLVAANQYDGQYYFLPNPAASTDVGYGYGFGSSWSPYPGGTGIGYGYGFQVGNTPSGYGFFDHDWEVSAGYGPVYSGTGIGLDPDPLLKFEPPGPRYQINFLTGSLPLGDYTARLIVNTPDGGYPEKCFLSDLYDFEVVNDPPYNTGPATYSPPKPNLGGGFDDDCVATENITIQSDDGDITITIPEGCLSCYDGVPLEDISIDKVTDPPAPPPDSNFIGLNYDFGPDGATFEPPIEIIIEFDPALIPAGSDLDDLSLAYYDEGPPGEWVELGAEDIVIVIDPVTGMGTITAKISHFTYFSTLVHRAPASFAASNLSIAPSEVDIAESVTISAKITNTGDLAGEYDIVLKINGEQASQERLSLEGGSSKTVTYTSVQGKPGTYSVSLNGLSGKFTVRPVSTEPIIITAPPIPPLTVEYPKPTPPAPVPTPTPPAGFGPVSWWVILIIVAASVVFVFGSLWLLVFRRRA